MTTNSLKIGADVTIARLREALDVTSDQDLAKSLNVSKQTVSAWRRRNSVPQQYLIEVAGRTMTSVDHFMDENETSPVAIKTYSVVTEGAYGLCIVFYERIRGLVSIGDGTSTAMFWGSILPRLIQYYEYEVQSVARESDTDIDAAAWIIAEGIQRMTDSEALKLLNKRLYPMMGY